MKKSPRACRKQDQVVGRVVWLRCHNPRCPRKRKLAGSEAARLPLRVASVVSPCPWHEGRPGDFTTEAWYDKRGRDVSHLDPVALNTMLSVDGEQKGPR